MTTCETRPITSIGPVELVGHPVNRQTCWALQTGVHHNLKEQGRLFHFARSLQDDLKKSLCELRKLKETEELNSKHLHCV